jgi:hypothetical protein
LNIFIVRASLKASGPAWSYSLFDGRGLLR